MINYINLKWAKPEENEFINFGDDLNPYLVENLSGCKVRYIHFANSRTNIIKQFISGVSNGKLSFDYFFMFLQSFFSSYYVLAAGSIIQWYSSKRAIVWGSGILARDSQISSAKFLAVRGKYTQLRLQELGYKTPEVIGDPALLLPLIYSPNIKKKYKLGIIPHIDHFNSISAVARGTDVLIISLNNEDIEGVIDDICSCEYTISTSLHGLIVSHVYAVKCLWFAYEGMALAGDNVKFFDYFSSVNIPEYLPYTLNVNSVVSDPDQWVSLIEGQSDKNGIKNDLAAIQKGLLAVAPFKVKENYLN